MLKLSTKMNQVFWEKNLENENFITAAIHRENWYFKKTNIFHYFPSKNLKYSQIFLSETIHAQENGSRGPHFAKSLNSNFLKGLTYSAMAASSILLTAGTKQHCHSCNSSKKEKRFFQIFYSCAGNWGWKFTEKSIELSTKAELLSFSYRSNLPSYSVIHKLTLNSWVFLKTSYLRVPQDSSLAGKLEISNFKFLMWSDCFLRFVILWHCRKNNRGRERFLIRYPV